MKPPEKEIQVKKDENTSIKNHLLVLPYRRQEGVNIVNSGKGMSTKFCPKMLKYKQLLLEND